jgi:hypothetical protein
MLNFGEVSIVPKTETNMSFLMTKNKKASIYESPDLKLKLAPRNSGNMSHTSIRKTIKLQFYA